jgi:hypothetical protein
MTVVEGPSSWFVGPEEIRMSPPTRREFLFTSTGAAVGLLSGSRAAAQPGSVRVRRSITDPAAPIAAYRIGIRVMKARPSSDPTSWIYQANMHGTYTSPPQNALWNRCQHGSFYFQ